MRVELRSSVSDLFAFLGHLVDAGVQIQKTSAKSIFFDRQLVQDLARLVLDVELVVDSQLLQLRIGGSRHLD